MSGVQAKVSDVCQLGDGAHASVKRTMKGVPYLTSKNIGRGQLKLDQMDFISESDYERLFPPVSKAITRLQPGDVLTGIIGTFSNSYVYKNSDSFGISSAIAILRPDQSLVNPQYLYYYLNAPQLQSLKESMASGSVQGYTNLTVLGSLPLRLPALGEQQAIAEVLGALDDKIAANTKLAQTSASLTQAVFTYAVLAAGDEAVLSEITGLLSRGITPKYSDADDTVVILNQKCIRDQRVNLELARRTCMSKVREDKLLMTDDVLVNSTGQGTLGRVARWTHSDSVTVDSHITIVRFDQAKVDPVCAGVALLGLQETIVEMGEGSTGQTELSRTELGKLRVRLPDRGRQAELGRRFTAMAEMERVHLSENQNLAATRDVLLPRFMSGTLRVKDAEKVLEDAGV